MNRIGHLNQAAPLLRGLTLAQPSRWLLRALLCTYVAISLVDPMDQMFHLKSTFFITILAVWSLRAGLGYTKRCRLGLWVSLIVLALIIPLAATLIGFLSGRNPESGPMFSTAEMFLMAFLVLVLTSEEINLVSILTRECIVVALITLGISITAAFSPLLYAAIYEFTDSKQLAYLSAEADSVGLGLGSFYYKTCATLIMPLGYHMARLYSRRSHRVRNLLLAFIYCSALVLSGARANVLAAAAVVGVFSIKKIKDALGWEVAVPVSLIVLVFATACFLPAFFNPTEQSNAIKLRHWSSYITEFDQHPYYMLWGEGANTQFYSAGFETKTTITELTYMELVRNFGIPIAFLFVVTLSWPLVPLLGGRARACELSYLAIPYGAYLLMSASNPLLLNTTGMLVVTSVWGAVLTLQNGNTARNLTRRTDAEVIQKLLKT